MEMKFMSAFAQLLRKIRIAAINAGARPVFEVLSNGAKE
jgi:hypothetical protein